MVGQDHLAHLATWEGMLIALLEGKPIHTAFGLSRAEYDALESTDALNAVIAEQNREKSLDDVLRRREETHAQLVTTIGALPDEDLSRPITFFQPDDPDGPRRASRCCEDHRGYVRALRRASAVDRGDHRRDDGHQEWKPARDGMNR